MRNTNITLNLYEKQTLMQNRIAAASGLYQMVKSGSASDICDPNKRQFYGIGDFRPLEEILKDVDVLWQEIRTEISDTVKDK